MDLPTLVHYSHIIECMEKSGFEVLDYYDANRGVHNANEIPLVRHSQRKMSLSGFRMTHIGRMCTHAMVWTLETLVSPLRIYKGFCPVECHCA